MIGIMDEHLKLINPDNYPQEFVDKVAAIDWEDVKATAGPVQDYDVADLWNRTGHNIEDMLLHCKFGGRTCSPSDFTTQYTFFGKCHTFNYNASLPSKEPGFDSVLTMYLWTQPNEYLGYRTIVTGFKVRVHGKDEPPFTRELGFGIKTGAFYYVSLQKTEVHALGYPYGTCVTNRKLEFYPVYSIAGCRLEYDAIQLEAKCNCTFPNYPKDEDSHICNPEEAEKCADTLKGLSQLQTSCKNPCQQISFDYRQSSVRLLPSIVDKIYRKKKSMRQKNITISEHDVLVANFQYEHLTYEVVEQVPAYTVPSLMSDIGGQMGLFIGASILTLLHLGEFMIQETLLNFQRCTSSSRSPVKRKGQSAAPNHSGMETTSHM